MLIFATSDNGGAGRSVTSCNVAFRSSLFNREVCYLDFNFGSPTAGSIFQIAGASSGTRNGGLHSYLQGRISTPERLDIWTSSDRQSLRQRPPGAGQLILFPGDHGGSEFPTTPEMNKRCAELFLRLDEEFDIVLVDLSAGRSYATDMVLAATAMPSLRKVLTRWLIFHRWTNQHVGAAASLVYDEGGILATGEARGHDPETLLDSLRFVRTAVINPDGEELSSLRPAQIAFLRECDARLTELASNRKVGRTRVIAAIPLDPLLQWREQLISDNDLYERKIANVETVEAFEKLAKDLVDDVAWEVV
ncbi:SCO2523 family variant P-loop protein [Dactylosporangium sp. CS-047395]|uniref:SCO2523 family variant P-loop protein n=1 Tax=Dactylosporangium sp. CS-047395 TaxID=3239936 RepID=UPI003D8F598D